MFSSRSPSFFLSHFGHSTFRAHQYDIISAVIASSDVLAVLPTGHGKSLLYSLPCLYLQKIVLVVSPLISLMEDQMKNSKIRACVLHSEMGKGEWKKNQELMKKSTEELLVFVTPELCQTKKFRLLLSELSGRGRIGFIAIDEAHCISEWGHTFRSSYLQLGTLKKLVPNISILAVTATATIRVQSDIVKQLDMKNCKTFVADLDRPNIFLDVIYKESFVEGNFESNMKLTIANAAGQRGIVYCATRTRCNELFNLLSKSSLSVAMYHAGMNTVDKKNSISLWSEKKIVMIATEAFGMGIDSPDVRFVIHDSVPGSLEAYYQQIGRCGRNGEPSRAILYFSREDSNRRFYFESIAKEKTELFLPMQLYCSVSKEVNCRRKFLLKYFGSSNILQNSNCCDLCCRFDAQEVAFNFAMSNAMPIVLKGNIELEDYQQDNEYCTIRVQKRKKRHADVFESDFSNSAQSDYERPADKNEITKVALPVRLLNVTEEKRDKKWQESYFAFMEKAERNANLKASKNKKVCLGLANHSKPHCLADPLVVNPPPYLLEPDLKKSFVSIKQRDVCLKKLAGEIEKYLKLSSEESFKSAAKLELEILQSSSADSVDNYNSAVREMLQNIRNAIY